jgi:hypothetical protein
LSAPAHGLDRGPSRRKLSGEAEPGAPIANEELAGVIVARTTNLQSHFGMKLTAMQSHIYGKLPSMESDMLDPRAEIARLREAVTQQAKALNALR